MRTIITYGKIMVFIITLITSYELVGAEEQAIRTLGKFRPLDANETPKILSMISDTTQANYEQIKTWEGKVESALEYIYEDKNAERVFKESTQGVGEIPRAIINSAETVIEFFLDAEKGCIYAHKYSDKPIKYTDFETGRDLGAKGIPGETRAVLTKEYYIKSRADRMRDGIVTSRKAIKKNFKDCSECLTSPVFDPRESFNAGQPVWKTLQYVVEYIKKNGELKVDSHNMKVEEYKDANVIQYKIIMPSKISEGNLVLTTMVFSSKNGFNINLFQVTDTNSMLFQNATWNYELIGGIYLPKETTHKNYMGKEGRLSYSGKSVFENLQINQTIPNETFTYKNLGLKNGDPVTDEIEDKEYKYQDGNLVLIPEPNNPTR